MNIKAVWKSAVGKTSFTPPATNISENGIIVGDGITCTCATYRLIMAGAVMKIHNTGQGAIGYSPMEKSQILHKGKVNVERSKQGPATRAAECLFTNLDKQEPYEKKEKESVKASEGSAFPLPGEIAFRIDQQAQFDAYTYAIVPTKKVQSEICAHYDYTKTINVQEGNRASTEPLTCFSLFRCHSELYGTVLDTTNCFTCSFTEFMPFCSKLFYYSTFKVFPHAA